MLSEIKQIRKDNYCMTLSSVQSLSCVWLFATPWTTAGQASQSITNSQSPPKPKSIVSVMPSNHLFLCHPLLLLPSIFLSLRVFSNDLPMNTQDWYPLGWTGWISLQFKGLSRVFSSTILLITGEQMSLASQVGASGKAPECQCRRH